MGRGQELLDAARKGDERTVSKIIGLITKRSGPFTSLRRGAGVNVQDDNGYTPLHHACLNGHREIVHILLSVDASPCVVDKKGATPLHLAAWKGDSNVVSMLLNHVNPPVNIDQKTNDQETALVIAAQFGFVDVVTLLITKGADVTLRNHKDESALDLAAQYGKLEVVRVLVNAKPSLIEPYQSLMRCKRWFSTTPLHRASMNGHWEVVAYLIDVGIDPNIPTDNGTALHEGVRYLSASVVKVLLTKGADLDAVDRKGHTVRALLKMYPEEATRRVKRVIREYESKIKSTYESEEDLPAIPCHDYSPTGFVKTPVMSRDLPKLRTDNDASTNIDRNTFVNNPRLSTNNKFQQSKRRVPSQNNNYKSACKSTTNGNLPIISDTLENQPCYVNRDDLMNNEMVLERDEPDISETLYGNMEILRELDNHMESNESQNSLKKKPQPPPKPQPNQPPMACLNELFEKLGRKNPDALSNKEEDKSPEDDDHCKSPNANDYIDINTISENLPDDEKVKRHGDADAKAENLYTHMVGRKVTTRMSVPNIDYVQMSPKNCVVEEYVAINKEAVSERRSLADVRDIRECDGFHFKGDEGCMFSSSEYSYIYLLNTEVEKIGPFNKKIKADKMPCFCHERKRSKTNNSSSYVLLSKNTIFDSLSDVTLEDHNSIENYEFEPFTKEPCASTSTESPKLSRTSNRYSKMLKKKIDQAKQLITNWKAPETQKHTNFNLSMSPSSSSLTKNHQSFVKKLASKCLGLKAKFNSAPNISNSSGLDSEACDKLHNLDQKSNSQNTLLIGNSKFFNKILSKKEKTGDVVCTDEFDTISLDRLGTLNRDSAANRSNRSCPGFKTSLPNISENAEVSDSESVIITEVDCDTPKQDNISKEAINVYTKFSIFEPRQSTTRSNCTSEAVGESAEQVNECYEACNFSDCDEEKTSENNFIPKPLPRANVAIHSSKENLIYENVSVVSKIVPPKPAVRNHIPQKILLDEVQRKALYENVSVFKEQVQEKDFHKVNDISDRNKTMDNSKKTLSSHSSVASDDSMEDESNLEDILLSEKSKSFKRGEKSTVYLNKSDISRTQSNASNASEFTEASAIENVDCSEEIYTNMTGTLPHKTENDPEKKKKILFRHKTFTNIEVDRNSINLNKTPHWHYEFMKETLAHYHIRGTGHCIYKAPTVQEFIYIFNREALYSDTPPFTKVSNDKRDSYYETAICFCKPKVPKYHKSAEDLLGIPLDETVEENTVTIDIDALRSRNEINSTSFRCFCDSGTCTLHAKRRDAPNNFIVKFSAVKKSISTPDITLDSSLSSDKRSSLIRRPSEIHYASTSIEDIVLRNKSIKIEKPKSPVYTIMSQPSTLSSSTGPYSIKDIADVISLDSHSESTEASPIYALNSVHLPLRKSTSSEYSGRWTLASCNSNTTVQSDTSFKTCQESPEEDSDDGTLHSDGDLSDADTVKSDVSTAKRPWVHSDSFNFGQNGPKLESYAILEEDSNSSDDQDDISKFESPSKVESGISVGGSDSSSSGCDGDSGIPGVDAGSLGVASLERDAGCGGVRSGSGRRRWDEAEGTSEGDALSVSSAASSCAPHHLAHHHDYSKVSPTPPKKPPRRNLSVSPTHANSPSSGYSYELRTHARSQDDLDEIQGAKHYLKHGRSVDQYVDGKLSYSEFEENQNSPRVAPIPNPRPSLKHRPQPVAITAMYENVVIKEQNPRRKLRRNNFGPQYENHEPRMEDRVRKYSNQDRSSLESLLDDQSMNSPSDCERYYDGQVVNIPLSPTHYEQPPTPDHPPPSARQAENSIHERIRPLSQEYKRRSMLRDSQTDTEYLLRTMSVASVASGATDRSGNTDCVEEYVCDVPFAGLFKGSTTTLDGIGLRPMPAERPKTLRKLKSVYDPSPTEQTSVNISSLSSNGQGTERSVNGCEDDVRRRSNTTSSTHSGDKSLSILSPFDEQEEWAKISEIMASFGSKLVRESVFVSELEQEFTSRLGFSCSESSLSPSVASTLGLWLSGLGLHDYEPLFLESGYDDVDFVNGVLNDNDLREMGIEENDRQRILESAKQLPLKITEISNNYNNNNISKNQNESVEEWLRIINLEIYSDTFRKHLYVDMDRVRRIWEVELTAVLEIQKAGHRKRILASVSGEQNGPANHMDINADLNSLKNTKQLKENIKERIPALENLKAVPPPVVPSLAPPGGETLKRSKKNRPAPQPPRPSDLEIRAPSELLVGVPGALKTQWKHQPFVLVTGAVTYVANYLGSTVVKELRGTESTKKSIQKLKKTTKEPRDSPDIILSISYRGVKFLNTITKDLICEHEIRNIHCACQDADDLTHFAYITKDHSTKSHYCHVFRVATMDQATEVILTLGEAFEVAYQMALREQANRVRVTQSQAKTPTHDPMTTTNKEKPIVNHGRSHSITEIKLNGHQLKIAPMPASLSNEDFQSSRNSDGSRSPRTPLLKAPIASTEEL